MRISDWSSDVCSSDLFTALAGALYAMMVGFVDPESGLGILVSVEMVIIAALGGAGTLFGPRSEEHTSELQSLMRISYAVFCLKKKNTQTPPTPTTKMSTSQYI